MHHTGKKEKDAKYDIDDQVFACPVLHEYGDGS